MHTGDHVNTHTYKLNFKKYYTVYTQRNRGWLPTILYLLSPFFLPSIVSFIMREADGWAQRIVGDTLARREQPKLRPLLQRQSRVKIVLCECQGLRSLERVGLDKNHSNHPRQGCLLKHQALEGRGACAFLRGTLKFLWGRRFAINMAFPTMCPKECLF